MSDETEEQPQRLVKPDNVVLEYLCFDDAMRDEARRATVLMLFSGTDGFDLKGFRDGHREVEAYLRDGATPAEKRKNIQPITGGKP